MDYQLRMYKIVPGKMDEFVALFRDHLAPMRRQFGFVIDGPWISEENGDFVWVAGHEDFEATDKAYYSSPERAALPDPKPYLESVDTRMLTGVEL